MCGAHGTLPCCRAWALGRGCAAPRPGPCATSACEPRQGRKAAALSRPWGVPQVHRVAVGLIKIKSQGTKLKSQSILRTEFSNRNSQIAHLKFSNGLPGSGAEMAASAL